MEEGDSLGRAQTSLPCALNALDLAPLDSVHPPQATSKGSVEMCSSPPHRLPLKLEGAHLRTPKLQPHAKKGGKTLAKALRTDNG